MAKVRQNIIIQGLSGSLGDQIIFKQDKGGRTIISAKPTFHPNREFSEAQKLQRAAFREASAYGQGAQRHPLYAQKAAGTPRSAYNIAMADWFHAPEVLEIDLSTWSGQAGQIIRIKAIDDVLVTKVLVAITDGENAVLEQGAATQADGLWWEYTTTLMVSGNLKVRASAQDLPGHIAEMTKTKYK